jgi:hypothetical protein
MSTEISQSFNGLSPEEVYIAGDGVRNAMTVTCDPLSESKSPKSKSAEFSDSWSKEITSLEEINAGLRKWCDYKPE